MNSSAQGPFKAHVFRHIGNFVRLGRPLHLAGGFVFNGLGIAVALFLGTTIDWNAAFWCQLAITSTQLMTHYSNDYFDQDADAAALTPTRWSSGSRVLPEGLVRPQVALIAALFLGGIALSAAAVLAATGSAPLLTLSLVMLAIVLAWSYSSPPLQLNRNGLGEIAGAILVPGLTALLGFQVQTGRLALLPMLAVVPLCLFQFAMLLSVNFPDVVGDAQVDKRTLVVILGPERASRLFLIVLALAYLLLPVLILLGLPVEVALAVLLTFPLAFWQGRRIRQGAATDPDYWEALAFWSIGLLMTASLLETITFLILSFS